MPKAGFYDENGGLPTVEELTVTDPSVESSRGSIVDKEPDERYFGSSDENNNGHKQGIGSHKS